jgi:hemimethylated DNA binding protein
VVRHKVEEWRAVIIGWEHSDSDDEPSLGAPPATSLTQKNYPLDPSDGVKYTLILDSGDAHLHYSKRRESNNLSMTECFESDLEEVKDKSLLRIRSSYTPEYFKRYDTESNNFIPNEIMAYEFPADDMQNHSQLKLSVKSEHASEQIISGVQEAANHLRKTILGYTSAPESRKMKLLGLFLDRLTSLSEGDVLDAKDRLSTEPFPSNKIASMHLQQLLNATVNIGDLLWQKRRNKENEKKIKFELGDIVKHKLYGFRGVVVAWDPEPTLDVSRWDGLSHIKNPDEFPFYQIIPDQNDCLQAFGGERSSRYVCEENLEICSKEERNVDIDLEPEWKHNQSEGLFYPPDDLKVRRSSNNDIPGPFHLSSIDSSINKSHSVQVRGRPQ